MFRSIKYKVAAKKSASGDYNFRRLADKRAQSDKNRSSKLQKIREFFICPWTLEQHRPSLLIIDQEKRDKVL